MHDNYYIIKDEKTASDKLKFRNLCIFCHYDKNNLIDDNVIHYIKNLRDSACEVIFISNCEEIEKKYLDQIKSYVSRIILRKNIGRDFACYYTGYQLYKGNLSEYDNLIFANDSVYGPFYSLSSLLAEMRAKNHDIWSIADTFYPEFFLESYFLNFRINEKVKNFLEDFFRDYDFCNDRDDIVERYEYGLSRRAIRQGLNLGSFCNHHDIIGFELKNEDEPVIRSIKNSIYQAQDYKINFKSFFSNHAGRYHYLFKQKAAYLSLPKYSSWYTMVKYFRMPFIKKCLLNNVRNVIYKNLMYSEILKEMYPDYDIELIQKHLKRTANYDIKNVK